MEATQREDAGVNDLINILVDTLFVILLIVAIAIGVALTFVVCMTPLLIWKIWKEIRGQP